MTTPTKTVSISFQVPADLDTPSETLAEMKALLLQSLNDLHESYSWSKPCLSHEQLALCKALLTES